MQIKFRGRSVKLSFAWLKPPPMPPDGNMTLFEHLRELRYRLVVAALAILVVTIVAYFFNGWLFEILQRPYVSAIEQLKAKRPDINPIIAIEGVANPLTLVLKVSLIAGLVVASPVWLYQIWAFIVPGLLAKEKKWSLIFVSAATPLFLAGVGLAYYVLPKGIAVLIGFTPGNGTITNIQNLPDFLTFLIRVMLVFGLGFEIPVFVLALNFLGVVSAKSLSKARVYVIFGTFVFGAVATPQTDPLSMCLLAVPMAVLYVIAEIIAHISDRRKARRIANGETGVDALSKDTALTELSEGTPAIEAAPAAQKTQTMAQALGLDSRENQS